VTASNNGDSSASALSSLVTGSQLHRLSLLLTNSLTTGLNSKFVPLITPWHGPRRKVPLFLRVNWLSLFRARYLATCLRATVLCFGVSAAKICKNVRLSVTVSVSVQELENR
jgi:hypothetical protein